MNVKSVQFKDVKIRVLTIKGLHANKPFVIENILFSIKDAKIINSTFSNVNCEH